MLITGAASGIGCATAQLFASEGANLVLGDINADGVRARAAELAREHRVNVAARTFDAGVAASCHELVDAAVATLGGIDIVVNVAGVMDWGPLSTFTAERWDRMMRINLGSVFFVSQRAMPHLVKTQGNIVNIASASALVGIAYTTAYCASKAGVVAVTKSLAVEFAGVGVRVNAICPGGVRTPMNSGATGFPEGVDAALLIRNASKLAGVEFGEPEDIANAIAFLAGDEARYASGTILSIDGAQTAG